MNSFYAQIAPYILLEYQYGDLSTTYISNQVKISKIQNKHLNDEVLFLNDTSSKKITNNVLDNSAIKISPTEWAYLNRNVPTPYINTDNDLIYSDLSGVLTSNYVVYDKLKIHLLSGYRLEDIDGLIIQTYIKESQNSNNSILCNNVFLKTDNTEVLNPNPILLGDRMYDRYVEVSIPSAKHIIQNFYSNPSNPVALGFHFSSDGKGILYDTNIYVKVYEISKTVIKNGNVFFTTSDTYETSVNQEDVYSKLSANISEADDGDYFLYYPTYDGNFIEDFLIDLNNDGGNYALINDIEVWEQVGLENILTFSFSQMQVGNFDKPIEWRPIIKYANEAVSFSIDYTVRIYNRENGFQIIRKSSTTSYKPKKYGKSLERIGLFSQSYPFKVYNRISGNPSIVMESTKNSTLYDTVYIPIFYKSNNIVIQNISAGTSKNVYFGQGDCRIYLSNFDSVHKFKIHSKNENDDFTQVDLRKGNIYLVFYDKLEEKILIELNESNNDSSRALGELLFRVPGNIKNKVLYDDLAKTFDIILETENDISTVIYTGSVQDSEKISEEPLRVSSIKRIEVDMKDSEKLSTKEDMNITTEISHDNISSEKSIADELIEKQSKSLSSAEKLDVLKPHIPLYSNDDMASSLKRGIRPSVNISNINRTADLSEKIKNARKL